jgi:DNA-directed RNA polymerase subunit E'/Rpb7
MTTLLEILAAEICNNRQEHVKCVKLKKQYRCKRGEKIRAKVVNMSNCWREKNVQLRMLAEAKQEWISPALYLG